MKTPVSEQPLVSIHLGCYNHSKYVVDALESIKAQTYKNYQVYIWDDCSQDNSREIIKEWIEKNRFPCTFVANTENLGLCRSLNQALAAAQGKYIAGFSADDVWLPDKIEKQVALFERLPESIGVIYTNALTMNEDGTLRPDTMVDWSKSVHPIPPEGKVFKEILKFNFVSAPSVLIRRSVFAKVGLYDESLPYEDFDMWLRISRHFDFHYMPECLLKYRLTPGALHTKEEQTENARFRILKKWLNHENLKLEERTAVIDRTVSTSLAMYRLGLTQAPAALAESARLSQRQDLFWASKASSFGVSFSTFSSIKNKILRIKNLIKKFIFLGDNCDIKK